MDRRSYLLAATFENAGDAGETATVSFEGAFLGDTIDVVATPGEDA